MSTRTLLRSLPSVNAILAAAEISALAAESPRSVLVNAAREAVAQARAGLTRAKPGQTPPSLESIVRDAVRRVRAQLRPSLRSVINATGVVLHTNLGRAILAEEAVRAVAEAARGYTNLELDLTTGSRGSRMAHLEPLLRELLGAQAAFVVNNNAAAMLLALNTFAVGREAVVSRGQLVEIGGSFRIPEILERAGAVLREVGTTNKTRLKDYERAIGPKTGMLVRVHPSNFAMVGFTQDVERRDLVRLARRKRVLLLEDIGSGALVDFARWGLPGEPLAREALREGVPLVCFSADKLLGGPQAGILAGTKRAVAALRANPMARALRVDKLTLAALEATLRIYRDPMSVERSLPTVRMLGEPAAAVRMRARRVLRALGAERAVKLGAEMVACTTEVGGGAMPLARVQSYAVALRPARGKVDALARSLREGPDAVLGRIDSGRLLLDLRTVAPGEIARLVASVVRVLEEKP